MKTSKRVISLLLSPMLVLGTVAVGGVTASADYHVVDGIRWIYEVLEDGKSVRIAYGTEPVDSSAGGLSGVITIPDRFQLDGREYTVKEIGDGAFNSTVAYSGITGIKIPASVESIGDRAFQKMTNLTSVSFGEGSALTTIGASAFYECKKLSSIDIPQGVTTIGNYAFYNCQNLESVVIPDNVTSVGSYLFRNCTGLESAVIGKSIAQLEGTFIYCSNLESLIIRSNAVTTFSRYTFYDCSKLTSITIPCNFDKAKFTSDSSYINVTDVGDTFTVQGTSASGTFTYTHNYSEPVWNWDDIEHPTYSTSCADCGDEKAGEADSVTVTHNNPDGAVPGCTEAKASVVIDGETYESTHIAGALEITDYAQLKTFASRVNSGETDLSAKLMNDIDASASETDVWTPIGYCEHDETGKITFDAAFIGTFDGDGHVITGLTCNDSSAEYAGLFGYVDAKSDTAKGNVKNVGLEGGSINGGSYAGGVVGYNNGGTVQNCYNTSNVSGSDCAGGVVGYNNGGTVQSCYNTGDVSGSDYVGGVAGDSGSPDGIKKVDNCYYDKSVCGNIGAVSGADIDTEDNKVKGLTTAQMTGINAISYDHEDIDIHPMYFNYDAAESPWLTKADGADEASGEYYWYYPQLKGFNKKADGTPETDPSQILPSDWPAKAEVSVTWSGADSYAYDGSGHSPCVAIGDISVPEGGDATYSAYNGSGWGADTYDFPTLPGKYRMTISFGGNIITKYFEILNPDTDYRVSYYAKTGEPAWSSVPVAPVDVGEYKAVVTFTASGHKRMEKEFTVTPRLIWHVSEAGLDNTSFTYDGTEKEPELAFLKDTLINKELVEGVDYRILHIEWKNNVNASDPEETDDEKLPAAVIDIEGMGNYYHSLTYTLFFTIEKADPEVTAPVPVEGLKCDGSMKELVTPGKTTGGTLEYSLDGEDYSPDIPRAAEEGGYTVYYRVTGNENYNDVEAQTVSAAIGENIHTITFIVDGEKTVVSYNYGSPVEKPADPAKEGYIFAWVDEIPATMPAQDVTINGKFTAIEYTATFVDENGETVKAVKFTIETEKLDDPAVPEKEGYTGKWEEYTLGTSDITIKPVYANITSIQIEDYEENSETGYKEDKTFTVKADDLPDGAEVHWFVNGEDVGTGESYTVENPTEDYTIQAKVIDKDGNVVSESEEQKVTVKNGFFDRLKAFFADLIEKILGKAIADFLSSVC